ncbi:MAG TPA: glycine/betaine ABC transporter [Ruminococcaceae bacterium]|jgi:osmoprotectant transport system permease protein|nr:glycine/betaine ABC transporter [Oscillospiraceae bacterium]
MIYKVIQYISTHADRFTDALETHLLLSGITMVLVILLAVPLGILCAKKESFEAPIMHVVNALKVLPVLVLIVVMLPLLGVGFLPALVALLLQAIPIIVINTYSGFKNIDPGVLESAVGMGLSKKTIFWKVEFPLAMPLILTGIRIGAIDVIAGAMLASYIGGGGLGDFIVNGIDHSDHVMLMVGSIPIAFIAVVVDISLALVQRHLSRYQRS